ncbi:MAG: dTDP-4-dehydrorhamnose reductase [Deltaproteobacteria bacterium]|nr:dTDP-4-dehydrorhamnose reductase [Deltaproteobacteria bacterium]
MKIWLTGAKGMLGRTFETRLSALPVTTIGTDIEIDISDADDVMRFAERHGFSHIINCAAYTQVDRAEAEVERANAVNRDAPGFIGAAAARIGASVLHFSTDYVFDGRSTEPYSEEAACAPLNSYGKSKLVGEHRLFDTLSPRSDTARRVYTVRTSWLFGDHGPNFVRTMLELMVKQEVLQVVDDQTGRPTYCDDLVEASLALFGLFDEKTAENPPSSGRYHFANSGATSWHGFASGILEIAREMGFSIQTKRIEPVKTSAFPRLAVRPLYSVLATDRITAVLGVTPRPWQLAVRDYLNKITTKIG